MEDLEDYGEDFEFDESVESGSDVEEPVKTSTPAAAKVIVESP
jgi:hypothetical protein